MNRRTAILIGVLVLQLALVAVVFWPRRAATAEEGLPLFPGLSAEQVTGLTVTGTEGQAVHVARAGDGWVLPEAGDYPVLTTTVATLLDKVTGLASGRLVGQTAASQARLKVAEDDFNTRLDLDLADGSRQRLYLGSPAGADAVHVRAGGQEQVYLVSGLSAADVSPQYSAWIDTTYFAVAGDEATALALENANGRIELTKDAAGSWTMAGLAAGEAVDQDAANSLLTNVTSVSMLRPLGKEEKPEYGLQAPLAVVTVTTAGGTTMLRVGAQDAADQGYVLHASGSPYYVRAGSYVAGGWIAKTRADMLQVPATPAP